MRAIDLVALSMALTLCIGCGAARAGALQAAESLETKVQRCASEVHPQTLKGLVRTESSGNPFAIGIVGARLQRQPRTLDEAVAIAQALEHAGYNFSLGLAQINRHNLSRVGLTYASIFEPCANLRAGSKILKDCYVRARTQFGGEQSALRAAFSCYYAGNFTRGFTPDHAGERSYVQKVVDNAMDPSGAAIVVSAVQPQLNRNLPLITVRTTNKLKPSGEHLPINTRPSMLTDPAMLSVGQGKIDHQE